MKPIFLEDKMTYKYKGDTYYIVQSRWQIDVMIWRNSKCEFAFWSHIPNKRIKISEFEIMLDEYMVSQILDS
jgi:hypothetical protein